MSADHLVSDPRSTRASVTWTRPAAPSIVGTMLERDVGLAGIVPEAGCSRVRVTPQDGAFSVQVERLPLPSWWDARDFARSDHQERGAERTGMVGRPLMSHEPWTCTWTLAEADGESEAGRRLLVLHGAHGGLGHRVTTTVTPSERERAVTVLTGLAPHLAEAGVDLELDQRGEVLGTLWAGRAETGLLCGDDAPGLLRELVAAVSLDDVRPEVILAWTDPDIVRHRLTLARTGDRVDLVSEVTAWRGSTEEKLRDMTGSCTRRGLAAGVARGVARLLAAARAAGYRWEWVRSWFPATELEQLEVAVRSAPPPLCLALPKDWTVHPA